MNTKLLEGFPEEIAALKTQLADERAQLDEAPEDVNPEIVGMARDRFQMLEELIEAIEGARNSVFAAEAKAVERARRNVEYRAAVRDVVIARARLEEFESLIRVTQKTVDEGEAALARKQALLTQHLNNPVREPEFAAPIVIRRWDTTKNILEENLAAQSRALGEAKAALTRLRSDLLQANDALYARPQGLLFRAQWLAPRVPQKEQGVGRLGAVN